MKIDEVQLITFSPTGTSRRVAEAIVRGIGLEPLSGLDLTWKGAGSRRLSSRTLAVVAVPVYGGRVAPLALERMKKLSADGTPAVLVVVYGNRAYEQALVELDAFATKQGFKVIAGGTFVGEHSYSSTEHPVAPGRPDAEDVAYAEEFGRKVRAKIDAADGPDTLYGVDVRRIRRPRQPLFPLMRFLYRVVKLRKSGMPMPRTPESDEARCTHCGRCVRMCPTGAIAPGDECHTLVEKCIRCCACVKGCPQGARSFNTPFATLLSDCFKRPKENQIIL